MDLLIKAGAQQRFVQLPEEFVGVAVHRRAVKFQ